MYNQTLKHIKKESFNGEELTLDFVTLRAKLTEVKKQIELNCPLVDGKQLTKINTHVLDEAIKLACSNYNSAKTNFEKGNIKKNLE